MADPFNQLIFSWWIPEASWSNGVWWVMILNKYWLHHSWSQKILSQLLFGVIWYWKKLTDSKVKWWIDKQLNLHFISTFFRTSIIYSCFPLQCRFYQLVVFYITNHENRILQCQKIMYLLQVKRNFVYFVLWFHKTFFAQNLRNWCKY